jgi:hypothetical protein
MSISLLIELPEPLHQALLCQLSKNPEWNQERVIAAALALFLLRAGSTESAQYYLEAMHLLKGVDHAPTA